MVTDGDRFKHPGERFADRADRGNVNTPEDPQRVVPWSREWRYVPEVEGGDVYVFSAVLVHDFAYGLMILSAKAERARGE